MSEKEITWTKERLAFLIQRLRDKQKSPSISMEVIAMELGISKNAVCGKVGRLRQLGQLPKEVIEVKEELREAHDPNPKMRFPDLKPLKKNGDTVNSDECAYVYGDPREKGWKYCGRKTVRLGSAWCPDHEKAVRNANSK